MAISETKVCQSCQITFEIDAQDFQFYEKMEVPPPTWCPQCRAVRRMSFWNEHELFRKKEANEGREIFSTYPEEAAIKIYDHDYWWSDKWDPFLYGKDYDFSRSFFEQYREMIMKMPWPSRSIRGLVNSDYCNQVSYLKNCYLCFNGNYGEDCLYGSGFQQMKISVDFYWSMTSELSYELSFCDGMYHCFFSVHSGDCRDSWFLMDCVDCSDCFGCIGLRHKQYYIFNVPYTKEEYAKKIKEFNLVSHDALARIKKVVYDFWLKFPRKYMHGVRNENVSGDYIYSSRNCKHVFQGSGMDNVRYSQNMGSGIKDSYDYTNWGETVEHIYESVSVGDQCTDIRFSFDCWPGCENIEYCISCHSSANLFGCFGLKKKQYCILNKQYTKEEYEHLREKIIPQMQEIPYVDERGRTYRYGEFFPPAFSPLAYNETVAMDYFPLTKGEANEKGYAWRDSHPRGYRVTIGAEKLSDRIADVAEEITKELIGCASCKRAYRILPRELEFYKRFALPLPRLCPGCRSRDRLKWRNPIIWQSRNCMCAGKASDKETYVNTATAHASHDLSAHCPNTFETSYAPDRPEIVYCEQCYQAEVV